MARCVVKAEAEHERKVRKKELARQQGEGTWMLQSIDERVKHEEEVMEQKQYCISIRLIVVDRGCSCVCTGDADILLLLKMPYSTFFLSLSFLFSSYSIFPPQFVLASPRKQACIETLTQCTGWSELISYFFVI